MAKTRLNILVVILTLSLGLALLKPAILFMAGKPDEGPEFKLDFGNPVLWDRWDPETRRVEGFPVPQNSIGLDFLCHNIYIRCAGTGVEIYQKDCPGDPIRKRGFYGYPPLMPHLMSWLLLFSFDQAMGIWAFFVLASILGASFFLVHFFRNRDPEKKMKTDFSFQLLLAALLGVSYPALFSFERGNTDNWVLLILCGGVWAMAKKHWKTFGILLSLGFLLKIYPLTLWGAVFIAACFAVNRTGLKILTGQLIGAVATVLPLFKEHFYYFSERLPFLSRIGSHARPGDVLNHSLKIEYGMPGFYYGILLWGMAAICLGTLLRKPEPNRNRLLFFFCYLAALMTFLLNIDSADYNLITAIPLLLCLAFLDLDGKFWTNLGLGLFAAGWTLPRWLAGFFWPSLTAHFSIYVFLQALGLGILLLSQLQHVFDHKIDLGLLHRDK